MASIDINQAILEQKDEIKRALKFIERNHANYEWGDEGSKKEYGDNVDKMMKKLDNA